MKHAKKFLTLIVTVFISNISCGQPNSEMYLSGKWTASCAVEILDYASIRNCQLCPFVNNPNDKSSGEVKDIEMTFQSDSILINQNGKITTVRYTRNKDTHAISFTLNNKQYNFRMFIYNKQRILEDKDGLIMILEKKDSSK